MIKITARGFDLVEGTKLGVEKELKRVERMLPKTASFDVTLSKKVNGYNCDIIVKDAGSFIKGEALADSIQSSIDLAVDDLKRKIRKLKTYFVNKKRKRGIDNIFNSMVNFEKEFDLEFNKETEIVKTKKVLLQMMDDEEALVQMEMLGHSYFIYIGEDGVVRVVYKRKKGYGLLICDR